MMDYIIFEDERGRQLRPHELGIYLKSFSAPPPEPKIYREAIDGADGEVDMTEWAGEIRYNTRTVTIDYRDMAETQMNNVVNFLHGRRVKIIHSRDLEHYYEGRCDKADVQTKKRVTDASLTFTCFPYRRAVHETRITKTVNGTSDILLQAVRESVIPTITTTAQMTLQYEGATYSAKAGTFVSPDIVATDVPKTLTVKGTGKITLTWRDGEL